MTRLEEKLYLESVFNAIDEVYQLKTQQKIIDYEQRLRNSLSKLLVPDWYNPDYTSTNILRKSKSHSQVPRSKTIHISNGGSNSPSSSHRYRCSSSQAYSEKLSFRRNSTVSSSDTNTSVITNSRRSSTYAPGTQRVAQSSKWYRPKIFPRTFQNDSKCVDSRDSLSSLLTSKLIQTPLISNGNIRQPTKRRAISQLPVPPDHPIDCFLDTDIKLKQIVHSMSSTTNPIENEVIIEKNLLVTDSSSCTSVNEQCLSSASSSLSYHTARAGDTSSSISMTAYETPTPHLDDATLSSHSSLSDLSHAETLEPNVEDLDIAVASTEEQKTTIIPSVDVGMENFPLPPVFTSSSVNENSPSNESRPIDNSNWYDDGSIATCIDLVSPRHINDDESAETSMSATNRLYTLENDDVALTDDFHCSSTVDPFGFNQNNNNSSIMITDLDDLLIDDELDDESQDKISANYLLNTNYRRPIQEDILYEVEHENSYSDHSPNNSIIIPTDDNTSKQMESNIDYLTPVEKPMKDEKSMSNNSSILPIYTPPPLFTSIGKLPALQINSYSDTSSSFLATSYTPKIRHRHFSVGSYYDNKTTTVAIHPNHTLYIIGSAPVSPINRTASETNYHLLHHSPVHYPPTTLNTLQRLSPFLETNTFVPTYDYPRSPPIPPLEREAPLVRPKTSRGRSRSSPPSPPPRIPSPNIVESTQNIYQEIDNQSTDDDQLSASRNDDLQFIRGTIERVFDFHGESASESSTNYEVVSEEIKDDQESISLSDSSRTVSKKESSAYPAVEAVQRFYETKSPSESEKKNSPEQTTDLDNIPISDNQPSTSNKLYSRSHPANQRIKELSKSSDNEQATSEEIDDTLNDIEDDDYQDEKLRRQATTTSSQTSDENSPLHSYNQPNEKKKTSQETQTIGRPKPIILTTQSPSGSQGTVHSYETARSSIPPLDIVTQMVIERTDGIDDGRITEISGDMIIFYDDIEIVEHSSDISTTDSETTSSMTRSLKLSKSVPTIVESQQQQQPPLPPPPPPIPARTLKPLHLMNNQQQSTPSPQPPTKVNRTYELEKASIRKKFDVNSVNNMLNRTDYFTGPTVTHRHPSARHFVGKLNSEDSSSRNSSIASTKPPSTTMVKSQTLPLQTNLSNGHSSSTVAVNGKHRSTIADTNALVKQIQNSLSRNSLHDSHLNQPLSVSTKDLRTFVSSTYSPSDENTIDDDGIIHVRHEKTNNFDEQTFKRQARLSKSFHNVSEYSSSIDQYPKKETNLPSKSVENNLNHVTQNPTRNSHISSNFPPIIASTSFSALPQEDNARLLSMKWYTGQVSENSEICYNTPHLDHDDLLYAYISAHSNRDTQLLLSRLQASNDIRIHAALDDIRLRVAQFDAVKSAEDIHVFMRYLESRLRDINNKNMSISSTTTSSQLNGKRQISNGFHRQQSDTISIKSRTSSIGKDTPTLRQMGRQHRKSSGNLVVGGGGDGSTNEYQSTQHPPTAPPRRASQSSIVNQENPQVFDEMLNTVLGLQKKGASNLSSTSLQSRDKSAPLIQTPMTSNTTAVEKNGRNVAKRLFESGTYKDPRLIYDGPKRIEKEEEQPLETSV